MDTWYFIDGVFIGDSTMGAQQRFDILKKLLADSSSLTLDAVESVCAGATDTPEASIPLLAPKSGRSRDLAGLEHLKLEDGKLAPGESGVCIHLVSLCLVWRPLPPFEITLLHLDYCYYLPHSNRRPPYTHTHPLLTNNHQAIGSLLANFAHGDLPPPPELQKVWDEELIDVLSTAFSIDDDDAGYDNRLPSISNPMDLLAGLGAALDRIVRRTDFILKHLRIGTFRASRLNTMGGKVSFKFTNMF